MQQSQEMTGDEKAVLKNEVDESLGSGNENESSNSESNVSNSEELPEGIKKRLGMQEKRHKKEMKRMQQEFNSRLSQLNAAQTANSFDENNFQDNSMSQSGNTDNENIRKAVSLALKMEREKEQKSQDLEKMQHVHKQYRTLEDKLDQGSNKYEDFDDVVKSEDAPYTDAMRDASLLIPNPDDTLYHLGKDRDKLQKISKLHPLEQAREIVRLSMALMAGNGKKDVDNQANPLPAMKNSPNNSRNVNENTPISEIRERMKSGKKKWF